MKKSVYWIVPLLMMFGLGLYGCADSLREGRGDVPSDLNNSQGSDDGEWIPYTMEFNASDMITPSLRALTEEGENDIKGKVRVLVFDSQANTFAYEAPVTAITPADNKKTGKVQLLLKNTEATPYKIVMLANLQEATPEIELSVGAPYDEVMKQFTYAMPANGLWENGALPMWGEITAVVNHDEGANPKIGTINLIRAVARIDVGLSVTKGQGDPSFVETAAGIDGITMTSVKFYNMNDKGMVAPASANLEENSATKVKAPTVPTEASRLLGALNMSKEIIESKLLQRSVYVPEAKNDLADATQSDNGETHTEGNQDNYMKRPYMVVGLIGADKSNPSKETFFRIDFLEKTGAEATAQYKYLPLLRNYRYLVNITNVGGPGFDKEEDAQKGPAANIMYNVVVWNESDMTDVMYDGQYMLGVSQDKLFFYRDGGEVKIKAQTTWPDGLEVKGLPKEWLEVEIVPVDPAKNSPTDEHYLIFKAKQTDSPRKGEAYIQAGRIRWDLDFEQTDQRDVSIAIFLDEECTVPLQFSEINQYGEGYNDQNENKSVKIGNKVLTAEEANAKLTFYVKTNPQNIKPEILGDGFTKFQFTEPVYKDQGVWEYTVTAKDLTANNIKFESFTDSFEFKITYTATKQSAKARLSLLQKEYDAIPFGDKDLHTDLIETPDGVVYLLDGTTQSFYIQANTEYELKMVSNLSNNAEGPLIEEPDPNPILNEDPTMGGTKVDFKAKADLVNPTLFAGRVKYVLTSPTGRFPRKEFYIVLISAIKQPEANTYMIKANAKQGILIPVSRVNTARAYYETLLNEDTGYFSGAKDTEKLPGSKAEFMLRELADDDDFSVNIIWTDIHKVGTETKSKMAGLDALGRFGSGGPDSYIFVKAGDTPGNVLISIRSNKIEGKPILWSWHIWIVDEYPATITRTKEDLDIGNSGLWKYAPPTIEVMERLIGAEEKPLTYGLRQHYREQGFQYQWGRKDPFPTTYRMNNKPFYDGEGNEFDFRKHQKGDGANYGEKNAINAVGGSLSMRGSIENPATIVSHQQFWQFENFPWTTNENYRGYKKYTFRYPWNRYSPEIDHMSPDKTKSIRDDDFETIGGKTVFDPSPYGFRIMSYGQGVMLRKAYYDSSKGRGSGIPTPRPGWIYDGSYTDGRTGSDAVIYAVSQARADHAGYYLISTNFDWSNGSNNNATYKRANTFLVRPVVDPENYGLLKGMTEKDYKKYLPQ